MARIWGGAGADGSGPLTLSGMGPGYPYRIRHWRLVARFRLMYATVRGLAWDRAS